MTTVQIMESKKALGIKNIEKELWRAKPNQNKMAEWAILGGISPAEVAALESSAQKARAMITELAGVDLPALKAGADRSTATAATAQTAADEAQRKADSAKYAANEAEEALAAGMHFFRTAANSVKSGTLPASKCPTVVRRIVEYDQSVSEAEAASQSVRSTRYEIQRIESMLSETKTAAETAGRDKNTMQARPGGLVDAKTAADNQVKKLEAAFNAASKSMPKLKKAAAAALAKQDRLKIEITAF